MASIALRMILFPLRQPSIALRTKRPQGRYYVATIKELGTSRFQSILRADHKPENRGTQKAAPSSSKAPNTFRTLLHLLDIGAVDHLLPLLGFGSDIGAELFRRLDQRGAAEFDQALFHVRLGQDGVDLGIELG